ncbi:MAG TPA: lipoyl(octanoyl) transferase LipB, partial [Acidimicrobiia bacterium]
MTLLRTRWLGRLPYTEAWDLQRAFHEGRVRGRTQDDYLLLLEHPPVFTIGRNGDSSNLLVGMNGAHDKGAEVHHIDRGGDITFHGPGQLVGYPIIQLEDPKQIVPYVRKIEEVLIRTLADFGVEGWREDGYTGVWTGKGKVAAIGIRVSRRVTMHGFALNLHPDMDYFGMMNPCGITDREVATLSDLVGRKVTLEEAVEALVPHFEAVFGYPESETKLAAFVRGQGKKSSFEVDRL